jgi:DNA mismatch repair ATPase MutS
MAKMRTESRRKLVEFDEQTWHALNLLSRESRKSFQDSLMRRSATCCTSRGGRLI